MKTEFKSNTQNQTQSGFYLTPFQRKLLQKNLENQNLSQQYQKRIKIMLLADEGKNQTDICKIVNCCQATARHWILVAQSGQAHHWQNRPIGRPKAVNEEYLQRLKYLVQHSPKEFGYPFRRWTAGYLSKHLAEEFGIEICARHINRLLKKMGLSTRSFQCQKQPEKQANTTFGITIKDLNPIASTNDIVQANFPNFDLKTEDLKTYGSKSLNIITSASSSYSSFWRYYLESGTRELFDATK